MNMLKGIGNPQTFVNERINNPQVQNMIKQYGSPENAFRSLCKQRGLDADTTINTIRQFLGKQLVMTVIYKSANAQKG